MRRPLNQIPNIGVVWQLYPWFFSISHSVSVNVVLALCPWYFRISTRSMWLEAGGLLCIHVTVMSATQWADINRWNSPLQLYHLCSHSAYVNWVRFTLLQWNTLPGKRHVFLISPPILPLFTYTFAPTQIFSSLFLLIFSFCHLERRHMYFLRPEATMQCPLL